MIDRTKLAIGLVAVLVLFAGCSGPSSDGANVTSPIEDGNDTDLGEETTTEDIGLGEETTTEDGLGIGNETTTEDGLGIGNETTTEDNVTSYSPL